MKQIRIDIITFFNFISNDKINIRYLLIWLVAASIQFIVFKILYPFPDFISDSYSYIDTNVYHMKVNLWPIGYSIFINWIHTITTSHYFLVYCQFVILELGLLYFFYSVLYLFKLRRSNTNLLFIFLFLNPMFVYIANCVLSDAIFCSISIIIFTQYLWMFHNPRKYHLVIQGLLIGLAFVIRYTAVYYPLVSIVAILLAGYKLPVKIIGIVFPWLIMVPFIIYTQQKTKELTGTPEFSVFGGWQLANNALYMYGHINVDSTQLPEGTQELDRMAKQYFRTVNPPDKLIASIQGTFFMKVPNAILKPYYKSHTIRKAKDAVSDFKAWGTVSPIYNRYGRYLIKEHPIDFARYYLLFNAGNYLTPHLEKFGSYNVGMYEVYDEAKEWFQLSDNAVSKMPSSRSQEHFFSPYPIFFACLNGYYLICVIYLLFWKRTHTVTRFFINAIIVATAFLIVNFGFSVFATPVVLRYQIVPMIILFFFSLYLTERLYQPTQEAK